jgi:hypothetical protein
MTRLNNSFTFSLTSPSIALGADCGLSARWYRSSRARGPTLCASAPSHCSHAVPPLGEPEIAIGHEPRIQLWLPSRN